MDSPSPPPAPDPNVVAAAQGQANSEAARLTTKLNRPNQITPFGTLTWSQGGSSQPVFNQAAFDEAMAKAGPSYVNDGSGSWITDVALQAQPAPDRNDPRFWTSGGDDNWTSTVTLDPKVQAIIDSQMNTSLGMNKAIQSGLDRVTSTMAQPLNFDGSLEARKRVEDALYGSMQSRLDPRFQQEEEALRSRLVNSGLAVGSEAYDKEYQNFSRGRNDAYQQANNQAILMGGQEQGADMQRQLAARNQILNELASLRGGQQVQMPQFQSGNSGATVNPAPIAQAMQNQYQGQLAGYNADVASGNALMGGLFSLGGAAMMAPAGGGFLGGLLGL